MSLGCPHPSQGCCPVIHQPGLAWTPPVCPRVLHVLPGTAGMTLQGEREGTESHVQGTGMHELVRETGAQETVVQYGAVTPWK